MEKLLIKDRLSSLYKFLMNPGNSLKNKVVQGGFWIFLLRIFNRGLGLIRVIILTNLLSPNAFGLFGIASLALASLESFSKSGFHQALIQTDQATEKYLDSAWTIQVIRGLLIALILFLGAPLVSSFFMEDEAIMVVRVIGLVELVKGFNNIGIIYFSKDLEFKDQFIYQISGTVASLVVALSIGIIFRSVWALVFGLLTRNIVQFVMSFRIHKYRPKFHINKRRASELFRFGKWVLGSSILLFLLTQGDDLFLGRMLGATALGFYQIAYKISNLPATEIAHTISSVTFPAYSKLQKNINTLSKAYVQTLSSVSYLTFPLSGGIIYLTPHFVKLFMSEEWYPIIIPTQVLVIYGLSRSLVSNSGSLFQGMGKPSITTRLMFYKLVVLILLIYPLTKNYQILGTSIAVTISGVLVDLIVFRFVMKNIGIKITDILFSIIPSGLMAVLMIGVMYIIDNLLIENINIFSFFLLIVAGLITYILTFYFAYQFVFPVSQHVNDFVKSLK